jgi:signal transduction histidine kinase
MSDTRGATDAWRRPAPTGRERRRDALVAVALAAGSVASVLLARAADYDMGRTPPSPAEEIAWCLAVSLPLAFRRRAPLVVLVVVGAAFIGLQSRFVAETQLSSVCLFLALFTAGAWTADRTMARVVRLVVVVVMFAWLAYALSATAWGERASGEATDQLLAPATASMIWVTALNVLYFGAAWFFGDLAWRQARQQALLEERTVELARERDENARRAVLAERVRIARELHDVVAHHVSVMGVQAGAARVLLDRDPEQTRKALLGVESGARSALDEMHRLLGVLRDPEAVAPQPDGDAQRPLPGVEAVPEVLGAARRAGLAVDFGVVGDPVPVPDSVGLSAYRILQEAVTNTVRHAAASRIDVRLRYLPGALEVEAVDDGRTASRPPQQQGRRGHGLEGMRERVGLHAGELEVGPRPTGGFRVRARFPLPAPSVDAGREHEVVS